MKVDQDLKERLKIGALWVFQSYKVIMGSLLILFVPQKCEELILINDSGSSDVDYETKICSELYSIANKYFVRYNEYKNLINKEFLVLYGEFIMRDIDTKNNENYYLSYDLFLLKFNL